VDKAALLSVLGWCTLINWLLLLVWWGFLALAGDRVYGLHGKWFRLSRQAFDATHYAGMALFKILIIVLNLVPYLALRLFV
jgi:hypothetical protein